MAEAHPYQITSLGDAALLVQFGNTIDEGINQKVLHLFRKLQALQLPYITDVVPAYSSLAVYYDVYQLLQKEKGFKAFEFVAQKVKDVLHQLTVEEVQVPLGDAPRPGLVRLHASRHRRERDRADQQVRLPQLGELNERDIPGEGVAHLGRHPQRQPRLAHPAGTGQRHEGHVVAPQQRAHGGQFALAALVAQQGAPAAGPRIARAGAVGPDRAT